MTIPGVSRWEIIGGNQCELERGGGKKCALLIWHIQLVEYEAKSSLRGLGHEKIAAI
jgi:hypothetical protein